MAVGRASFWAPFHHHPSAPPSRLQASAARHAESRITAGCPTDPQEAGGAVFGYSYTQKPEITRPACAAVARNLHRLHLTSPPVARSSRRSREQCAASCVWPHRAPAGFRFLRRGPSSALPTVPLCIVNWYRIHEGDQFFWEGGPKILRVSGANFR